MTKAVIRPFQQNFSSFITSVVLSANRFNLRSKATTPAKIVYVDSK